ncbi:hypothetical protein [Alicyclobacillus acidoterrestris]|uniref:Uncharacterized protein n=1 Tax=Alicyclobacillus acidoterrestris (strain ATCC 49025 / DSM 3922 / CIP 106132 / NCIMB 13137 / GD3B) TaxID=1356854 RepID=T0C3Z1_ALIAG|nr:hypothetical protein [Alicyclobacillus acidoterrestris]EPZ47729.1 hypothetical protein N007_05600 [Alicyclobacillus acidoterrestris ATCC 49025]UNO47962.1 hypothetical protein K1I37_14910 [Alicyclobacillus acidoterrestris]
MTYNFDDDYKTAIHQFQQYVDAIINNINLARKSGTPIPLEERLRRVGELTDAWMEHSVSTYGPDVTDEHQRFTYTPPTYQLDRLASVILQ